MPRPTTKIDLIAASNEQFNKMELLLDSLNELEKNADFNFGGNPGKEAHWKRDKNLRDVLVHLYEWHQLLLNWVQANQNGEAKPFLPEPYNWKTYGDMNGTFVEKHQSTTYAQAHTMLLDSHKQVMDLIDRFSNDELFSKNHLSWTGTSPLGSYCASATASHYEWALKKVKKHIKTLRDDAQK